MAYTIHEVVERTGLAPRTIREWVSRGAVPPPRGRGLGAHYTEDHVLRLMAVQRMREQGLAMRTIKADVRRMSLEQIADWLGVELEPDAEQPEVPPSPAPSPAPAPAPAPAPSPSPSPAPSPLPGPDHPFGSAPALPPASPRALARDRDSLSAPLPPGQPFVIAWLLPQLGLIVGQNAPPLVRRIAAEIYEAYAARGVEDAETPQPR